MSARSGSFPGWAWWLSFLVGWPVLMAAGMALFRFVIVDTGRIGTVSFAVILVAFAWLVAHFAGSAGAPKSVWSAILLGSLPLEALLGLGVVGSGDPLYAMGWALSLILPPLAAFIELRQIAIRRATSAGGSAVSGSQA